ncbi:MAG: response regulator [Lachnospiraceae bacterium]|nr:response regulator [Lachnospiraceae bacterium]
MDKYTILLADDEEDVIQVIIKKINWEELGFSVIGYANNGVKALEIIEELQPDVVMTDIKMPYMDGIELSNRIKAGFPATKILFFTGFDEFEYAKEAVHLEVEEYILKPVNSIELTNVFKQLKIKLDQEINEKRNVEILQKYYLESLPLLQADFYSSLIEGRINEYEIPKYLSDYQLSFPGPFFCCLVIHTSSNPVLKNESMISELTDECDRFCKYAKRIIGAVVTIGVGKTCRNILELSQSYRSARVAVSYRVIYGASRAINIKEIVPQKIDKSSPSNDMELSNLFKIIRLGSEKDVIKAVGKYLDHTLFPKKSLHQHHIYVMELISTLYKFSINNDIDIEDFSTDIKKLYGSLLDLEPDALQKWLVGISLSCHDKLIVARNKSTQSLVDKAKEYVHNNYTDEELSLDSVCNVLGVSNSYFSTIFKKETGNSFITYLTDYRMDRASCMLLETNEKSYIIAKNVGYTDPNYFSYVFKRCFGVSPSKYRTEHTENEK